MELLALLGVMALIPLFILYSSFAWGYVSSVIYTWFIIPVFTNAPTLTWLQLAGIMFFINCFVHNGNTLAYLKDEVKDTLTGTITSIIAPFLVLFGAWIFKVFLY